MTLSKNKWMFILFIVIIALFSTACSQTAQQEVKSNFLNSVNTEEVYSIKEMVMDSGVKLGDLFEAGISSPTYEFYDPAEDGNTYVTIKGNVNYRGKGVVVTIQYKKISEDEEESQYEFYTLALNDIPQNQLEIAGFFEYLYSAYEEKHNKKETVASNISTESSDLNQNNSHKMIEGSIIKSFLPAQIENYSYGDIIKINKDFNNDGTSDTLKFYFEQISFYTTYFDGKSNFGNEQEAFIPDNMVQNDGDVSADAIIEIAVVDLNKDGDLELLIAVADEGMVMSGLSVCKVNEGELQKIGYIEGQYEFIIESDGNIFVPVGSQGLGDSYTYDDITAVGSNDTGESSLEGSESDFVESKYELNSIDAKVYESEKLNVILIDPKDELSLKVTKELYDEMLDLTSNTNKEIVIELRQMIADYDVAMQIFESVKKEIENHLITPFEYAEDPNNPNMYATSDASYYYTIDMIESDDSETFVYFSVQLNY